MDAGVQQLPTYTEHQLVLVGNTSSSDVIDVVTAVSAQAVVGGAAIRSGSPWLWAPHVAIGALLLLLMAASFVRFHCKYGHKYRTGSQSFSSTFRLAPKTAWTLDKKTSATSLPRSRSGVTVAGSTSGLSGRRAARPAAVIVLKPVGGGVDQTGATCLSRRSVVSADDSTTTVDETGPSQAKSAMYNTSGGSMVSVKQGDSTTLDIDLMSTSRGSDEDWVALGLSNYSSDPWSAIEHRHGSMNLAILTTTAIVSEEELRHDHHPGIDWSGTAATSQMGPSTSWWVEDSSSTRGSDMFSSLSAFRDQPSTLQEVAGVPDDTERLIDDNSVL